MPLAQATSDDHAGLRAAREARFPSVPWQRCQFHLQQNAGYYVPRLEMRREVAGDLRAIFESGDRWEAQRRLQQAVDKYAPRAPKLSTWLEANVAESFTVFAIPPTAAYLQPHGEGQQRAQTSNARGHFVPKRSFPASSGQRCTYGDLPLSTGQD